jgi:hypothetical protein
VSLDVKVDEQGLFDVSFRVREMRARLFPS